jgi:purine-binding chemotaxis protein CheW
LTETFVIFEADTGSFGLNIQNVVSIEKVTEVSAIPSMPDFVTGIVNIRGQVIPVVDLSSLLFNRPLELDEHTRFIVVETNDWLIAFTVGKTNEILDLDDNQISPIASLGIANQKLFKGVSLQENRIIMILDVEQLLSSINDPDLIRKQIADLNHSNLVDRNIENEVLT